MSFLQLVLSHDKKIKEIILLWRICQFDQYRNNMEGELLMRYIEDNKQRFEVIVIPQDLSKVMIKLRP